MEEQQEQGKNLNEYLDIFIRRKYLVIIPFIFLSLITLLVVSKLPSSFKSEGLILIEAQEIPTDLVKSTVTSYADQRIQVIKQRIMTTENVMEIVKKFNLYNYATAKSQPSQLVSLFKANMSVQMVEANVTDPRSGRQKKASIAFKVSFLDPSPKVSQLVANELVTKFLTENTRTRTERAAETQLFLEDEAKKFQQKIQNLEKNIADFKNEYSDSLPELLSYNLSTIERLENELVANRNQIMALKDQITAYTIEQSSLQRYLSVSEFDNNPKNEQSQLRVQLAEANSEYNSLVTKYSLNHPDVIYLKKQIESIERQIGIVSDNSVSKKVELDKAINELEGLKQKYSENHPDVRALSNKIEQLKLNFNNNATEYLNEKNDKKLSTVTQNKINPIYTQLETKIKLTEREIQRLNARQHEVNQKLAQYEQRVLQTHQVERAYDELIRDHANHLSKYQELRAKQLEAQLAQNLESENKGETFTLIEPPQKPSKAEKPNRPKLIGMGIATSLAIGFSLALLYELLFAGIRGYRAISQIIGQSPLIVLPIINTNKDLRRKRYRKYKLVAVIIIVFAIGIVGFHFYIMNIEVFWFKLMRKISLI